MGEDGLAKEWDQESGEKSDWGLGTYSQGTVMGLIQEHSLSPR